MLALLALAATVLNSSSKTATTLALQNSQQQKLGGHTLTRPTGPTQMWVDRPQNTTLRNDAKCCGSVDAPVLLDTLTVLPGEVLVELVHRVEVHAALDFQITARGAGGHFHTRREPSHYPQTRKTL